MKAKLKTQRARATLSPNNELPTEVGGYNNLGQVFRVGARIKIGEIICIFADGHSASAIMY